MIKKHILSCSAVFVLLSLAKVTHQAGIASENHKTIPQDVILPVESPVYLSSLHFADAYIPADDAQIVGKMQRYLERFSFEERGNYIIHELAINALPEIEPILDMYDIPNDFKYIPIIESRFRKNVTSPKGASGYWQFMPETARAYGLTVSDDLDERQDLMKSTHAAAKYLQALYKEFEDWALVTAAYNMGSGNLRKAIASQKEDNYFHLKLNRETSNYVYQLIAVKEIIMNPTLHGYSDEQALLAQALHLPEQNAE